MSEYGKLGIDYDVLDESKRSAIAFAQSTSHLLELHGGRAVEASRGASAFVLELAGQQLAFVVEGLGTKSIISRRWLEEAGEDRFADVGIDAVGAIVNDVCSVGALPLVINAYFATGRSDWHAGGTGLQSLLEGWRRGCELSEATWGGGESPALPDLVSADDIELAGAAIGLVPAEWGPILGDELRAGDAIVLVESSGLHANGASLARSVAAGLPDGLLTAMPGGRRFGDALLDPSVIYVPLVAELRKRGIRPSYLSHITGHGMRKLMRAPSELTYVVDDLPPVPEVLRFLAEHAGIDEREAYGTFNMGAGFAVYVAPERAQDVVDAAAARGLRAAIGGHVEAGPRSVELASLGVTYRGDELELG
ncbi:MAG: phosphoribosylformylglycinamidine cyclo-ligase [Solirubrobacteraceae bacterium]|nr:phosphoribosylformylglycinamidine cyclo-ligase [Solirubrobacteraceae bacterium]